MVYTASALPLPPEIAPLLPPPDVSSLAVVVLVPLLPMVSGVSPPFNLARLVLVASVRLFATPNEVVLLASPKISSVSGTVLLGV